MWKYKLNYPFGGFGGVVMVFVYFSGMLSMPFWFMEAEETPWQLWVFRLLPFIVMLIAFVIAHWKTSEDRQKIREAKPLEWSPLPKDDIWLIKPDWKWFLILLGCLLLVITGGLVYFIIKVKTSGYAPEAGKSILKVCLILVGILSVPLLYTSCYIYFWSHLKGEVETAFIPVDHSYLGARKQRWGPRTTILVCYLPSGRYRFLYENEYHPPRSVQVVRCKGHIRTWGVNQDFGLRYR